MAASFLKIYNNTLATEIYNRTNASERYQSSRNNSGEYYIYPEYNNTESQNASFYFEHIERALSGFGFVLNLSAIVNILSFKGSLKTQFKLILSLAISDGLIDLFHFLLSLYDFPSLYKVYRYFYYNPVFPLAGLVFSLLYATAQYAGLGTMCAIAIDVLIKVRKPFRYPILMSKYRGTVIITCLWLVPAVLILTTAFIIVFYNNMPYESMSTIFVFFSTLYCFLCCLFFFVFIIIYSVVVCTVQNSKFIRHTGQRRSSIKMAVTFFLIIISYFVCIMPGLFLVLFLIANIIRYIQHLVLVIGSVSSLYILNTILDPIIYAVRIPEIRERYRVSLWRCRHCLTIKKGDIASSDIRTDT